MAKILFIFLFLIISSVSLSQKSDTAVSEWSAFLSGEGLYQSGNTSKFFLQSKGELKRDVKDFEGILFISYGYGESKGKKDDNSFTSSLTGDFFRSRMFTPFLLQIIEYSFAKGIDIRSQSGAGLRYTFIREKEHKSSISAALIYDYTNLAQKPGNYNVDILRLSFRVKTRQEILNSKLILSFTGFYQPALKDFSAANIRIDFSADIPIVSNFYFRSSYLYSFEDVVSVGRKRLDNKITFGLGISFGR